MGMCMCTSTKSLLRKVPGQGLPSAPSWGCSFPPPLSPVRPSGRAGGVIGHVWHGMSRGDMKDLGEALDAGTAALVVVGKSSLSDKIAKATAKAQKTTEKQLNVDAKDFDKQLEAESKAIQ